MSTGKSTVWFCDYTIPVICLSAFELTIWKKAPVPYIIGFNGSIDDIGEDIPEDVGSSFHFILCANVISHIYFTRLVS
jgi:hypothetical protein